MQGWVFEAQGMRLSIMDLIWVSVGTTFRGWGYIRWGLVGKGTHLTRARRSVLVGERVSIGWTCSLIFLIYPIILSHHKPGTQQFCYPTIHEHQTLMTTIWLQTWMEKPLMLNLVKLYVYIEFIQYLFCNSPCLSKIYFVPRETCWYWRRVLITHCIIWMSVWKGWMLAKRCMVCLMYASITRVISITLSMICDTFCLTLF